MKQLLLSGAGLIAAALALSACGASAGATPAATTTAASGAATTPQGTQPSGAPTRNPAAFEKFQACLAQHGVTVTPGQGFGGGFGANSGATQGRPTQDPQSQDPKARAAFTACRALLPQGSFGQRDGAEFQAFRTCLADHGVQEQGLSARPTASPDASTSPNQSTGRAGVFGLDLTNPKTKAAYDACKVLLPARATGAIAPVPSASAGS